MTQSTDFDQQIIEAHRRLDVLARQALDVHESSPLFAEAVEELATALEELHVADEELHQRNDELLATRQAIEEERQRYQDLFDFSPDGYLSTNPQGMITDANRAAVRMIGVSQQQLLHKPFFVYIAPEDRKRAREGVSALQRGEETAEIELLLKPRITGPFPALLTMAAMRDRDGVLTGLRWQFRDITERRRIETALRETSDLSEQQVAELTAIIASIADGLIIFNVAGEAIRMNPAAERIIGNPTGDATASLSERLALVRMETPTGELLPVSGLPVMRVLRGEHVQNTVLVLRPAAGKPLWLSSNAAPIRTPTGELLGAVLTFTDITDLRELRARQDAFIHTVTHDLRTPLTAIMGYASLLRDDLDDIIELDADVRLLKDIEVIKQSSKRMNAMIDDLVDTARLEGGQLRLALQSLHVREVLADLLEHSSLLLDISRIVVEVPVDLPPICADHFRLERIFANLLTNAIKYSTTGTPIRVTAEVREQQVLIAIRDQGPGIAADDLAHLFERYFRAQGGKKAEGLGLGLYTTKMLVEAHGGRIWAESEFGQGSTFYLMLPLESPATRE